MDTAIQFFLGYGLPGAIALILVILVPWAVAHFTAAPGCDFSYLWGLVKYQKRVERYREKKQRPIKIISRESQLVWRTQSNPLNWLDTDISRLGPDHIDSLLSGPYHLACHQDLTYLDVGPSYPAYRVAGICPVCEVEVKLASPERKYSYVNKKAVLYALQRIHFSTSKRKLKSPTYID